MSSASTNSIPALAKKSVKARFCKSEIDLTKLRVDLRQRCKQRMKEQREEMLNQKRFGVSSSSDVSSKLKEIFYSEMKDLILSQHCEIPAERIHELLSKLAENVPVEPQSVEEKLIIEEYNSIKNSFEPEKKEET